MRGRGWHWEDDNMGLYRYALIDAAIGVEVITRLA